MADGRLKDPKGIVRDKTASADSALKPKLKLNSVELESIYLEPFSEHVSKATASVDKVGGVPDARSRSRQNRQEKAVESESLHYDLTLVQLPESGIACRSGPRSAADCRCLDPPPVVKLNIFTLTGQEKQKDITMSHNACFTLYATLEASYPKANPQRPNLERLPVLTGVPVATPIYQDKPAKAAYFMFHDLSVRHEGLFRFRFHLFENVEEFKDSRLIRRREIVSDPFQVFSAKTFTELSDSGYGSRPGTSADGSVLDPSVHQTTWLEITGRDRRALSRFAQCEAEDTRKPSQEEPESKDSKFGDSPFKRESSTSGPHKAAASPRVPENGSGQESPGTSVSSAGERSFVCSMDSDELAEDWEANLDPILRLLRSKLIDELIDTYMDTEDRDETLQYQLSTAARTSDSSVGSGQDSSSRISLGSKPSKATSFARVKQHLYHLHKRPDIYCLSCFDIFKSEDLLSRHSRARPSCEVRDPRFEERMTTEQVNLIKRRSASQTLEETCFGIFKILFPGSPLPVTPFVKSVSTEEVQRFADHFFRQARARLSRLVQAQLEGRMLLESDQQRILESALESAIAQLVWQTGPHTDNSDIQQDFPDEDVQHRDAEDSAIDGTSQAPFPQVTPSAVLIGDGNVLEDSLEDFWLLRSPGHFESFDFGSVEDTYQ